MLSLGLKYDPIKVPHLHSKLCWVCHRRRPEQKRRSIPEFLRLLQLLQPIRAKHRAWMNFLIHINPHVADPYKPNDFLIYRQPGCTLCQHMQNVSCLSRNNIQTHIYKKHSCFEDIQGPWSVWNCI